MNLTNEIPTATRGVFSKNIVITYLPSVADGFIVSIIKRPIWRVNDDRDRLREEPSLNRLFGISSIHDRLIIVEDIYVKPHFRGEKRNKTIRTNYIIIAHK